MIRCLFLISFFCLFISQISAQTQLFLESSPEEEKKFIHYPDLYLPFVLHDTILKAQQGFKFENFASVRFYIDPKGRISHVDFSSFTDSLLRPHLLHVLESTQGKWRVYRNGKQVKEKVCVVLPVMFYLRSTRKDFTGPTNVDMFQSHWTPVGESTFMFNFTGNYLEGNHGYQDSDYDMAFEGIVLRPITVTVPYPQSVHVY
ncbi:hypothetical protein QNI19_28150 [Cytophagaceae bacterium DM2B3-1]|uniref:TonB C-terminal domain-containing protein n=1 Tax=Xanthocytophaga flava TaxID=3048013 RepID=A0ABT7CT04_9BACT|nr:hypothetical protein [Xanthocytophaga flavus]MDJ1496840.1 hypothetical protein [Xanthocytophaga flavus]